MWKNLSLWKRYEVCLVRIALVTYHVVNFFLFCPRTCLLSTTFITLLLRSPETDSTDELRDCRRMCSPKFGGKGADVFCSPVQPPRMWLLASVPSQFSWSICIMMCDISLTRVHLWSHLPLTLKRCSGTMTCVHERLIRLFASSSLSRSSIFYCLTAGSRTPGTATTLCACPVVKPYHSGILAMHLDLLSS